MNTGTDTLASLPLPSSLPSPLPSSSTLAVGAPLRPCPRQLLLYCVAAIASTLAATCASLACVALGWWAAAQFAAIPSL